jgi:hypothetical protein
MVKLVSFINKVQFKLLAAQVAPSYRDVPTPWHRIKVKGLYPGGTPVLFYVSDIININRKEKFFETRFCIVNVKSYLDDEELFWNSLEYLVIPENVKTS